MKNVAELRWNGSAVLVSLCSAAFRDGRLASLVVRAFVRVAHEDVGSHHVTATPFQTSQTLLGRQF